MPFDCLGDPAKQLQRGVVARLDLKGPRGRDHRDDDPVIFLESKVLYDTEAEVPDEAYTVPFGKAGAASSA